MQRAGFLLATIFAGTAICQDLPPGVLLLSRVESHIKDELHRLSAVSCIETVQRQVQKANGKPRPLDTVRLEVITDGDKEMFAAPGDRRFSEQAPLNLAGSGMLGNGLFGPYLKNILLNGNASTKYKGEEMVAGRMLARYDYALDPSFSGQSIEIPEGSGNVGLKGSFWADPKTYDIVRLELDAADIPPTLPLDTLATTINYGRTLFGNNLEVLLPETADVRMVKNSGETNQDNVDFTQCRVFGAASSINFSTVTSDTSTLVSSAVQEDLQPLPAGLEIGVKLQTRLSADTPVGTLIQGVVAGDVKQKHTVVIPAGAQVRGRVRRLEHYDQPSSYYIVGLEFTEVEVQGKPFLFSADLEHLDLAPGVSMTLQPVGGNVQTPHDNLGSGITTAVVTREKIYTHNLPGVATFFYTGDKLDLPQGFHTQWKTLAFKK